MMRQYLTLDNDNQFQFSCPIFNVTTKMSLCMKLRELVWMGKRPDVRKGCQACMSAGKCPAAAIVSKISYGRDAPDEYGSKTPVTGKLRKDILERVHRPMVLEKTLNDFEVPAAERELIAGASDRIGKMIGAAPLPSTDGPPSRSAFGAETATPKSPRKATPKAENTNTPTNAVNDAAASGNLAAAINAA
jgi:hypothetical protein